MTPKFWGLNANSSKTVKATDFKYGTHLLRDNTDMTPKFFFQNVGVVRVTWPLNFGGLNANSFKMVKATDFKFDRHFLMYKTDMTPIFFKKGRGQGQVTPLIFGGKMPIAPKRLGATDFKFGMQLQVFRENTDMTPNIFASKGAWPGLCYPLIFPSHPCLRLPLGGTPYRMSGWNLASCLSSFWHNTGVWQTDG